MRTRDLLNLRNTGHPGINSLFSKAHSADWDIDRDVDWSTPLADEESLVEHEWTAFGKTPTFQSLPERARAHVTRRGLGRMLNVLQVGESVAQDVCSKISLCVREEDYRNHAVAQAMDEARHHLAYRRFIEKMSEGVEEIDMGTEMMFDSVLGLERPLDLIATEQFFLESLAMNIFESIQRHASNPLLRRMIALITRDESRHMGFGVLYLQQWMREHPLDEQIRLARQWIPQILSTILDRPGPIMMARTVRRLEEAGVPNAAELGGHMLAEQQAINAADLAEIASGAHVPHLLKNARRVGFLRAEILEELGISDHPLIRATVRLERTELDAEP